MLKAQTYICQRQFFPAAPALRREFEDVFRDPLNADARRFCFDPWHVPGQYNLLRTPAWEFFPPKVYRQWHLHLIEYAQRNFGCHEITPPWLSLYLDGGMQGLHADVPHGPWAFVYSLTSRARKFSGGETLILRPETLDYWGSYHRRAGQSVNAEDLMFQIPPKFNQLLVFDPRVPHGVAEVRGVRDPLHGRLVVHGWLREPAPFVLGGLERRVGGTARVLTDVLGETFTDMPNEALLGNLVLQLKVARGGQVLQVKALANTLNDGRMLQRKLLASLRKVRFPSAAGSSEIVVPVAFDAS